MIKSDLEKVVKLNPKHLSFYSLILEDNTILKINKYKEKEEDEVRNEYDFIYSYLKENGYSRYEVSNFAIAGYECKHNLIYWNNEEYYAIGVSASSYVDGIRYTTNKNISKYIDGIIEKESFEVEKEAEYIMLKLRLDKGFDLNEYKCIFLDDFLLKYKCVVDEMIEKKLLIIDNNHLKTTYEGMMLLDNILVKLMWGDEK
jgi:oxygen-independent coproporphyrinogen-3 oxidase